jgi:hypothetical protein
MSTVSWKAEPDAHDYPAAASYLSLLAASDRVEHRARRHRSPARAPGVLNREETARDIITEL